jgi:dTDP-4-amino-4,6-dideoxygalactose transaminase
MDPALVEDAVTPATRAILCVHQIGMPCDLEALSDIAQRKGLPLIEDAACAAGTEIMLNGAWRRIGAPVGDIACFSFHPRKLVSTGDGGMITTRDAALDRKFKLLRQHGMSVPDTTRHGAREVVFETHDTLGYNYRMTDIQAAVGREQLKRLPDIVAERRRIAKRYEVLLADIPGVETPIEPARARSNWQSYSVKLPGRCDQKAVMQAMLDDSIATRRGIMCAHREAVYRDAARAPLPCSEAAQDRRILLPLFPQITETEQARVVESLKKACAR